MGGDMYIGDTVCTCACQSRADAPCFSDGMADGMAVYEDGKHRARGGVPLG